MTARFSADTLIRSLKNCDAELEALRAEVARLRGAMAASDERLRVHGERVGLHFDCDNPEHMADEILALRAALAAAPCWVSVTERLPTVEERDGYIAARIKMATFVEATYDGNQWLEWDRHIDDWKPLAGVTHWHTLPGL